MANELLSIGAPIARGMPTGDWGEYSPAALGSKAELRRQGASFSFDGAPPEV